MEVVDNYLVIRDSDHYLGKGSFSKVYLGKYIGEEGLPKDSPIAVKVIKTDKLKEKTLKILREEISIMKIIKKNPHPNIVECYDVIEKEGFIYIMMEYCDSGDLRSILGKPIKEKYTQFYFSQLTNGLKYLDQINIVHRDIKPRNILLTHRRRVLKIADFGFAKQTTQQSLYETICGSPLYMAPEIMGKSFYNKQTDLWSVGMILYEMLYGFHPFQDCKNLPELMKKIETNQISIPPVNTTNTEVSESCLELLRILLKKEVKYRITWDNFFNHPWLSQYQYIIPYKREGSTQKKNEEYEEKICSVSVGSLATRDEHEYFERMHSKIEIIEDYINNRRKEENDELIDSLDTHPDKNLDVPDGAIFGMEMEDTTTKEVKTRSVVDKSSILDSIDNEFDRYEFID